MDRLAQLETLLKEDPKDPFLHYAIALEYASRGDKAQAIARIEKLVGDNPDYLGAYYQLGQLYEQTQQNDKALTTYRTGAVLAQKLGNKKTLGELNEALWMLED